MNPYTRRILGRACFALAVVFLLALSKPPASQIAFEILVIACVTAGCLLTHVEPEPPWRPAQKLPTPLERSYQRWAGEQEAGKTDWKGPRRDN